MHDIKQLIKVYQSSTLFVEEKLNTKNSSVSRENFENAENRVLCKLNTVRKKVGQLTMFQKGKLKHRNIIHSIQRTYSNKEKN